MELRVTRDFLVAIMTLDQSDSTLDLSAWKVIKSHLQDVRDDYVDLFLNTLPDRRVNYNERHYQMIGTAHCLDMLCKIFGDPEKVKAELDEHEKIAEIITREELSRKELKDLSGMDIQYEGEDF